MDKPNRFNWEKGRPFNALYCLKVNSLIAFVSLIEGNTHFLFTASNIRSFDWWRWVLILLCKKSHEKREEPIHFILWHHHRFSNYERLHYRLRIFSVSFVCVRLRRNSNCRSAQGNSENSHNLSSRLLSWWTCCDSRQKHQNQN